MTKPVRAAIAARLSGAEDADDDELTIASNAAAGLLRAGKLDEAEQAARDLLVLFPDVHDGDSIASEWSTRPVARTGRLPSAIGR